MPLRKLAFHMGSHSVTCHPAEVTFPPLPLEPIRLVLDLATPEGRKAELTCGLQENRAALHLLDAVRDSPLSSYSPFKIHLIGIKSDSITKQLQNNIYQKGSLGCMVTADCSYGQLQYHKLSAQTNHTITYNSNNS